MRDDNLPTPAKMLELAAADLERAYEALDDAADWLRSDWPPGMALTGEQAGRRRRMWDAIAAGKAAIEQTRP